MKTLNHKAILAGAAIAGLMTGTAARLHAAQPNTFGAQFTQVGAIADDSSGKHSCKGQGGCKSGNNGCKGENSCKGKGGCATDGSKS